MQRCCWRFAAPVRPVELHLHPTFSSSQVDNVYSESAQTDFPSEFAVSLQLPYYWGCAVKGSVETAACYALFSRCFCVRSDGRRVKSRRFLLQLWLLLPGYLLLCVFTVLILSIPCNLTATRLPLTTDEAAPGWVHRCINCRLSSVFFFFFFLRDPINLQTVILNTYFVLCISRHSGCSRDKLHICLWNLE